MRFPAGQQSFDISADIVKSNADFDAALVELKRCATSEDSCLTDLTEMKTPLMEFLTPLFHKLLFIRHTGTRNLGALNELALLRDDH